jgi:SAM-dependent methyltransferase
MSAYAYEDDPKRLAFTAARYKHVAKLLEGKKRVLEVGCADGYFSRIVRQHVDELIGIDVDAQSVFEAIRGCSVRWPVKFYPADIVDFNFGEFDAVYSLDVLEHIDPDREFLKAMSAAAPVAVIGTPSHESQEYASRLSREGHVNCFSGSDLKHYLQNYWPQVFMFTMHDEAIGTGYLPMANYLLALCVK